MNPSLDRLARDICSEIEEELERCGLFYRIFHRAKTGNSIRNKIITKNYKDSPDGKLLQDIIGIRIAMYFEDDINIVMEFLKKLPSYIDDSIDPINISVFKPTRINLIFRLSEDQSQELWDNNIDQFEYIDNTFEVQLRTVLSEGWHEVEHDLRYKCQSDWDNHADLSHILNGIYASLVTSDWSILSIFENLSFSHYKSKNWSAMMRNKFRLRFSESELDKNIEKVINDNKDISKQLFKSVDREDLLKKMLNDRIRVPLTLSNLVFIINAYYLNSETLKNMAPSYILNNKKLYK